METHRGPVLTVGLGERLLLRLNTTLSMAWTSHMTTSTFDAVKVLSNFVTTRGQDFIPLLEGVRDGPTQNVLFVLSNGTIGYRANGRYPNYTSPSVFILDGTTSKSDWRGLLPASSNLHLYDPPKGYIATANSRGAGPHFHHNNFDASFYTARMARISGLLEKRVKIGGITVKEMWEMQEDTVDLSCLRVRGELGAVLEELREFDCDFRPDSVLATRY